MSRQAALNGCTESEPVLCAFLKSKQTTLWYLYFRNHVEHDKSLGNTPQLYTVGEKIEINAHAISVDHIEKNARLIFF